MRKTFATLSLATALVLGLAAPSFADQDRVPQGATASGAWSQADGRTPLAGSQAGSANFDMTRQGA
ncbi:hypothetical protein J8J14_14185 [Roseomonas sp. SSH11]|uniref:Uncharacterized protein n=1 Tax=Pararoseomonas baculiformis TaxID=2820812 RepID=A0ABS4AFV9_9PROT|nr:hypothetical protein [Pararoseomonas baculiformis]MBP0445922.1 hypothetical protein [Pararoseomonas baculiformis]